MCISVQLWQWNVGGFLFPQALVSLLADHRNAARLEGNLWLGSMQVIGSSCLHILHIPQGFYRNGCCFVTQ